MLRCAALQTGLFFFAAINHMRASCVKFTARRLLHRRRNFAFKLLRPAAIIRVKRWNGRKQRLCIGMPGRGEKLARRGGFHKAPQIHHRNVITCMCNHGQVVTDKHKSNAKITLKLFQKVQNICLDRNVKRRHAFIGNYKFGARHQRPGN